MNKYYLLGSDRPDEARPQPDLMIQRLWVVASLEIILEQGDTRFLGLRLNAYPNMTARENAASDGYWAPPSLLIEAKKKGKFEDSGVPADAVLNFLTAYAAEKKSVGDEPNDPFEGSVRMFAQSFGIRGEGLERQPRTICEIKPSNNDLSELRAFYTIRYRMTEAETSTLANLADFEGMHGFVFLPLTEDALARKMPDPNGTGRECIRFLGKPVMSGVTRLLESSVGLDELRYPDAPVLTVEKSDFSQNWEGIVCAADVAGYGKALSEKLKTLTTPHEKEYTEFRNEILRNLETLLTDLDTLHIQTAGDGFIAAFPEGRYRTLKREPVAYVLERWSDCVRNIEVKINGVARQSRHRRTLVGSRMAILKGRYEYGRINGITSFFPSFDGPDIVHAARMEQGLNNLTSKAPGSGHESLRSRGKKLPLDKQEHYVVLAPSLVSEGNFKKEYKFDSGRWKLLCTTPLRAKEFDDQKLYGLYRWEKVR